MRENNSRLLSYELKSWYFRLNILQYTVQFNGTQHFGAFSPSWFPEYCKSYLWVLYSRLCNIISIINVKWEQTPLQSGWVCFDKDLWDFSLEQQLRAVREDKSVSTLGQCQGRFCHWGQFCMDKLCCLNRDWVSPHPVLGHLCQWNMEGS